MRLRDAESVVNKKHPLARTSTTSQRIIYLKPLKAIVLLDLFANDVKNEIDEFDTFIPIVSGTELAKDIVVRVEDLAVRIRTNIIHGVRFEIHKDNVWNVPSVGVVVVLTGMVDVVLITKVVPKLGFGLVAALASLDVEDFSHFPQCFKLIINY
ncbi:hypothetical protein RJT34_32524 [Clitoria ternatea]|uniref:Uncharacterized protein n=1 Tax=Clitoria ternatea TaxID=43366 RepID=A0AAN9I9K9_CLITE